MTATTATWRGVYAATEEDHARAYARYGSGEKERFRWEVDLETDSPRISTHPEAANGTWTLAELEAGLTDDGIEPLEIRRRVARCARAMERAAATVAVRS